MTQEQYEERVRFESYLNWKRRVSPPNDHVGVSRTPYPSFADADWDWKQGQIIVDLQLRKNP